MRQCHACARDLPSDSRFCPACGAAVEAVVATGPPVSDPTLEAGASLLATDETPPTDDSHAPSSIDHGSFLPGTLIQTRYRIVGQIGRGGMGEVYRADDLKLGQTVALKFLPRALAADSNRLKRFHNEVRIARQVTHPNVCRVYDIGEYEGQTFLSMEFVDGEDLSSLLRRIGHLPKAKAIDVSRQLCAGLAAAHEQGVLHRDLKPMNVMVDGRGKVRITDFGLAALIEELDSSDMRAGTPAYMSPEQLAGKESSARSDVYSLGLVLYELFTGRRAYRASSATELARAQAARPPESPSKIQDDFDPAVERVIFHCLEHSPEHRPPTALAVAAALPGGDPLAAALAAGELPSPELVAASTHAEGVEPNVGLACLLVILAGIIALPFLNDRLKLHSLVQMTKPPEVLRYTAQEVLAGIGYPTRRPYAASGFTVRHDVLDRIETEQDDPARWNQLVLGAPPALEYWYRESPVPMTPDGAVGMISPSDPPLTAPGMILVRLSPAGELLGLIVTPPPRRSAETGATADFAPLLRAAAFSHLRFRPTTPLMNPPVFSNQQAAWLGYVPAVPEMRLQVEAAALNGAPVYFEKTYGFGIAAATADLEIDKSFLRAGQVLQVLVFIAALIGATLMARHNLRLGRSDRRGALRLAGTVAALSFAAWVLRADHVSVFRSEIDLTLVAAGRTLSWAALCWLFYVALEPHARRRWPDMLISWNRLLAGRVRDPLVGRDIIIGALFGIFGIVLTAARHYGPTWFGAAPPRPDVVPEITFLGLRYEIAQLLANMTDALVLPMALFVLLLVLIVMMRKRWLGLFAFHATVTCAATLLTMKAGTNGLVNAIYFGAIIAALLFVLLRFGLLAVIIALFYITLLENYPITADVNAWYAGASFFALGIASILALYGYLISVRGRPLGFATSFAS